MDLRDLRYDVFENIGQASLPSACAKRYATARSFSTVPHYFTHIDVNILLFLGGVFCRAAYWSFCVVSIRSLEGYAPGDTYAECAGNWAAAMLVGWLAGGLAGWKSVQGFALFCFGFCFGSSAGTYRVAADSYVEHGTQNVEDALKF